MKKAYVAKTAIEKEIIKTLKAGDQLIKDVKKQIKDIERIAYKKRNWLHI